MAYCGDVEDVHQIGFIEDVPIQFGRFRFLYQDLRGLRNSSQQFVRGMRGKYHRRFRSDADRDL